MRFFFFNSSVASVYLNSDELNFLWLVLLPYKLCKRFHLLLTTPPLSLKASTYRGGETLFLRVNSPCWAEPWAPRKPTPSEGNQILGQNRWRKKGQLLKHLVCFSPQPLPVPLLPSIHLHVILSILWLLCWERRTLAWSVYKKNIPRPPHPRSRLSPLHPPCHIPGG